MGVGGGFIMVPAMIYLLGMPTSVVAGTSLFQILFVVGERHLPAGLHHADGRQIFGSWHWSCSDQAHVVGEQSGHSGRRQDVRPAQFRILLALMVLATAGKLLLDLAIEPTELFSLQFIFHAQ